MLFMVEAGKIMQSESFIDTVVLPNIRELGYTVAEDPNLCFVRVRVDETVWIYDCLHATSTFSPSVSVPPGEPTGNSGRNRR